MTEVVEHLGTDPVATLPVPTLCNHGQYLVVSTHTLGSVRGSAIDIHSELLQQSGCYRPHVLETFTIFRRAFELIVKPVSASIFPSLISWLNLGETTRSLRSSVL